MKKLTILAPALIMLAFCGFTPGCGNGGGGDTGACNDGTRDSDEACDTTDFGGDDCTTHGFDSGSLSCRSDCTVDTSGCTNAADCPNGQRDPGEDCDGTDFSGDDCTTYGFPGGTLACFTDCTVDTSGCTAPPDCLDGVRDPDEQCDGDDFGDDDCTTYGFDDGTLACRPNCSVDTSGCMTAELCPDGERDPGEECDGTDFGGDDCTTYGFDTGSLSCRTDCTVDTSGCSGFAAECARHEQCAGHPDGDRCIFFEQRCGECLSGEDCSGAESVCDLTFTCVEPSDATCAASSPERPYLEGTECVECRLEAHCDDPDEPYCYLATHACGECLTDDHCTGETPICSGGRCSECRVDADCAGELCVEERWCSDCDPARCPAATPYCWGDACVECYYSGHCPDDHGCHDGTCVDEAIACSSDECDDHELLDACSDEGVCAECESDFDCWFFLGESCHDATDTCVDCNDDSDCWGDDRCTPEGECVECLTSADCAGADDPGCRYNYCDGDCATNADCTDPDAPVCDNGSCWACVQDSDCVGNPAGPLCSPENRCGVCKTDDDCAGNPDGDQCWGGECAFSCDGYYECEVDLGEYVCGSYPNNCGGLFECGACGNGGTCLGTDCTCPADSLDAEALNDTSATASDLGDTPDAPNSELTIQALSIDDDTDVDWFTFYAEDGFDFGNPVVTVDVEVDSHAYGDNSEYELTVWLDCAFGSSNDAVCAQGTQSPDTTHGAGCTDDGRYLTIEVTSNCGGTTDESAVGLIRVRKTSRAGRCDTYQLSLSVR